MGFPFQWHVCASIHYFFERHLLYIIKFSGEKSYVYFLIVCTTGVVKIILNADNGKFFKKAAFRNLVHAGNMCLRHVCVTFKYYDSYFEVANCYKEYLST